MINKRALLLVIGLALPAQAQTVLPQTEPPVSESAVIPQVEETPLGAPSVGAVGLLTMRTTGLPVSMWQGAQTDTLIDLMTAVRPAVPALREMLAVLLLAEADPPEDGAEGARLLAARLDRLEAMGAVDVALALLERAGHDDPLLFARWMNLRLLTGKTDAPCTQMLARPGLSSDLSLRVFCTARAGDWARAALTLQTAAALGQLSDRRVDLLERFLDPDVAEASPLPPPPVRPTPLEFRLLEALGEPLPTVPLPLPFAVVDVRGDNGWRAQLAAAERLARVGALPANQLLGLYSLRKPAASGGIWDRVAALQAFETALERSRNGSLGPALTRVWPQMASAGLLVPFAELFGEPLSRANLSGRAAAMARRTAFLSPDYETLAAALPDSAETRFLTAIARGEAPQSPVPLPHASAVTAAFDGATPPDILTEQLAEGRLGEVILRAIQLFASGAAGNSDDLTDAVATLRAVGLEDTARRASLQLMILDDERARR